MSSLLASLVSPQSLALGTLRRALVSLFAVSLCLSIAIQQTALGLLLAFLTYSCWQKKSLPHTPLDRPLLLFLGALLLSTFFSPDVFTSLSGYRKLWLLGAFLVTYRLVEKPQEVERLVSLVMVVAALVAAYGIVQHFTGLDLARQLLGKEPDLDPFWFGRQEGFRTKGLHPSGITYAPQSSLSPDVYRYSALGAQPTVEKMVHAAGWVGTYGVCPAVFSNRRGPSGWCLWWWLWPRLWLPMGLCSISPAST